MDKLEKYELFSLSNIAQLIPGNVYWKGLDGVYHGCSKACADMLKLTPEEFIGKTIFDVQPYEIANVIDANDQKVMDTNQEYTFEDVVLNQHGQYATYLTKKTPIHDKNGKVAGMLGISFDISERKQAELALQQAKQTAESQQKTSEIFLQNLRNILKKLPENIYWMDKEGRIIECNDQQAKLFGFASAENLYGKNIFDVGKILKWSVGTAEEIHRNDRNIMETGVAKIFEEILSISGEERTLLSHKNPLYDDKGDIVGIIGVSIDITERKTLEQSLKKARNEADLLRRSSDTYLRNILEKLPENIYWLDKNERIVGCNARQARLFGLASAEELYGKNVFDIAEIVGWPPGIAQKIHENDCEILSTGLGQKFEEQIWLRDELCTFLSYKHPLYDNEGNIIGIIGVSTDITERKVLERSLEEAKKEAEQASQAKSEFIMNMRHDLKTPTSGMLGLTKLLLRNEQDAAKKQQLTYLVKSCEKLAQLLDEIIDITTIGGNKFKTLNSARFSIEQATDDVITLLLPEAINKELNLIWHIDANIPAPLFGDRIRLHRILLNLISNALKFTAQGSVTLDISCKEKNNEQAVLLFIISDTGIGIAKEHHEKIFERFHRITSSYQGVYKGTGLGLHVVKEFVTELGGSIRVDSKLGGGTVFYLEIPFTLSAENEATEGAEELLDLQLNLPENAKILIVEDNIIAQKIAEAILQNFTSEVYLASTGAEALEKAQAPFDLIFLDIGLPDSSGFAIAEQISNTRKVNRNTPIIGLSAHIDKNTKAQASQHGMTALLGKPLSDEICRQLFIAKNQE